MKKNLFLSFLIPIFCMLFIFITCSIMVGRYVVFFGDSQYQYYPLLVYLKDALLGQANLTYSFQLGLSFPMLSTICYYLMSPFNILLVLFKNVELYMLLSIILRIGLCGLTAYLYLNYQKRSKHSLVFSTSYALSFYIIYNYYQVMWLDSYFLAPLLLLGIDKIINEKKPLLYSIILFIIILTNYYMGYMCALFGVLYFVYKYLNGKKDKDTIKIFIIISVLSGLMTMFIHLPNLLQIMTLNREHFRNDIFNFKPLTVISSMFLGSILEKGTFNETSPFLYIGVFNIILLLFYFINKKIDRKEKILSGLFILVYILSILLVPLNNFWHALSSPIGFNFRYAFLFNIFIISLSYKAYLNNAVDKKWYYVICLLLVFLLNIVVHKINIIYLYINIVLIIFYLLIIYSNNEDLKMIFILLAVTELAFNGYVVVHNNDATFKYYVDGIYKEKKESLNVDDNSFYRFEFNKKMAFNDALQYGYYGVTGWLSSVDINEDFYNKIGYYASNNTAYHNDSIVMDTLLGIKYYETTQNIPYYDIVNKHSVSIFSNQYYGISYQDSYIYKNPYALSLGYMVNDRVKEPFICDGYECQNIMLNHMIGYDNDVYDIETDFVIKSTNDYYAILKDDVLLNILYEVCLDDECHNIIATSNRGIFVKNKHQIGDEIKIKNENECYIYLAYINYDSFINNYNELKDNQLEIEIFKEKYIKGKINVNKNKVLFLSMPYNENFIIKVDGKKTDYYKVFDYFIGLDLDSGEHTIEIEYKIKGVIPGACVSSISFISLLFYIKKKKYY